MQFVILFLGCWVGFYLLKHGHWYTKEDIFDTLIRWDAGWYTSIAQNGYKFLIGIAAQKQQNIAFFPLYPLIENLFIRIFGFSSLTIIVPSVIFDFISIFCFYLLSRELMDNNQSLIATAAYSLYPGASFFISAYPTSLMNLLVIISMLFFYKKRNVLSMTFAGIGTAAGPLIVFVSFPIWLSYIYDKIGKIKIYRLFLYSFLTGIIAVSGVILFMLFQQIYFHDAFAFLLAQKAWGHASLIERLKTFFYFLPLFSPHFYSNNYNQIVKSITFNETNGITGLMINFEYLINSIAIIFDITISLHMILKKRFFLSTISFLIIFGYLWLLATIQGPASYVRLSYIDIPVFLYLGIVFSENKKFMATILASFSFLLFLQTALFVAGYWVV